MRKADLIRDICYRTGFTRKDVTEMFNAFVDSVTDAIKRKEEVKIRGFFDIYFKYYPSRLLYNVRAKENVTIPERTKLKMRLRINENKTKTRN